MELLASLLTDPKLWSVLSLPMVCIAVEAYAIWKLFSLYTKLQEQRLTEWQSMIEDYNKLCNDVNKTLDTLLTIMGKQNGGK